MKRETTRRFGPSSVMWRGCCLRPNREIIVNSSEFLEQLRAVELRLRSTEMQSFMRTQDQVSKDSFVQLRQDLAERISELANAELDSISRALVSQDGDITGGIAAAQDALAKLGNVSKVLDGIGAVLKIAAKIAGTLA